MRFLVAWLILFQTTVCFYVCLFVCLFILLNLYRSFILVSIVLGLPAVGAIVIFFFDHGHDYDESPD